MKRPNFLNPSAARELAWAERQKDWTLLAHEVAKGLRWKRDHSGMQAGTPMGEALRLFWQFKTFGIAVMQRAFLREFYGYGKGAGGRGRLNQRGWCQRVVCASRA